MSSCYFSDKHRICPSSENCHSGGSEHWKEHAVASIAGQKVCGRVPAHTGNPSHKYSLEL